MRKAPNRVITVTVFQKASCGGTDKYLKIAMDVFKSAYEILILILLRWMDIDIGDNNDNNDNNDSSVTSQLC